LETVRILFVIAALKKFKVIAADVASAYVQALPGELVYAIAGQEFDFDHCQGIIWVEVVRSNVASEVL